MQILLSPTSVITCFFMDNYKFSGPPWWEPELSQQQIAALGKKTTVALSR
jgi:hypothetical protein